MKREFTRLTGVQADEVFLKNIGKVAVTLFQDPTKKQKSYFASTTEKIRHVTPASEQKCENLNLNYL